MTAPKPTILEKDPFRLFFPISLFFAVWALKDWIFFGFGLSGFYPGQSHADLMFAGFMLANITGFLMTAIPRFTESGFATSKEILFALGILSATALSDLFDSRKYVLLMAVLNLLFLVRFAAARFAKRKNNPPFSFVFVGVGLVLGVIGFGLLAAAEFGMSLSMPMISLARALAYQSMVLSLVFGVGSRLIPGMLGWSEIVLQQRTVYENRVRFFSIIPRSMLIAVLCFIASFVIEAFVHAFAGRLARVAVTTWLAFSFWRIHSAPKTRTPFAWTIWISTWMMVLGQIANALSEAEWSIAGLHLLFVGGFCLLTLMVASRVILAHGHDGLGLEKLGLPYWLPAGLILLAAVTRWLAPIAPASYLRHLGYAAGCLIAGIFCWAIYFVPRLWPRKMR